MCACSLYCPRFVGLHVCVRVIHLKAMCVCVCPGSLCVMLCLLLCAVPPAAPAEMNLSSRLLLPPPNYLLLLGQPACPHRAEGGACTASSRGRVLDIPIKCVRKRKRCVLALSACVCVCVCTCANLLGLICACMCVCVSVCIIVTPPITVMIYGPV